MPATLDRVAEYRAKATPEQLARLEELLSWDPPPSWRDWLARYFPQIVHFAPRHIRLWEWLDALKPGTKPAAQIEVWPRGGGKSSTIELGCTRLADTLQRRFALYVCGSQDQADMHIQSVGALMESRGVKPQLNRMGRATGWRRDQLRAATGFSVAGFGMDTALRGIKIDQYRPDFIIFDDIDGRDDSVKETERKITAITESILPTGSVDCAVLFVQNLLIQDGVMARLASERAEFLLDRVIPPIEPAIRGLEYEKWHDGERLRFTITGGVATWEGQNLAICEAQMHTFGERAFLREAQHEVHGAPKDPVFDVEYLEELVPNCPDPVIIWKPGEYNLTGTLEIWEEPVKGVKYAIGADVAEGLKNSKRDESTADIVRCDTWEQVASYYGKPRPKQFAIDLYNIWHWYNRGILIPENNSFGVAVVDELEEMGVVVWSNKPDADRTDKEPDEDRTAGMRTMPRTKGLVDAALQSTITEAAGGFPSLLIRSKRCAEQCLHYVYLETGGRGGEGQWHDDHVRSLGLAWYVARDYGLRPPIRFENEDYSYGGYWAQRGG